MKLGIGLLLLALATSSAAPRAVPKTQHNDVKELAGRTAGKTQRCIPFEPGRLFTVSESDPHVLLYERGNTIWVSGLDATCGFKPGQTAVPDSNASYYCKSDLVRSGARVTLMPFGELCALGNFKAYTTK